MAYDSRSDHPRGMWTRIGKSKHGSSHPRRAWARYDDDWSGGRAIPDLTVATSAAIAEGLEEYAAVVLNLDQPADLPECDAYEPAVPLWWDFDVDCAGAACGECLTCEHDAQALDTSWVQEEPLAPWERELLEPEPPRYADRCPSCGLELRYCPHGIDQDEPDDDYVGASNFLPLMTYAEVVREMGDGFLVEGPSGRDGSIKAGGYMRVHELASEIGCSAGALVRHLRLNGEYVTSHTSYVALPVCDQVRKIGPLLAAANPVHKPAPKQALSALRSMLTAPPHPRPSGAIYMPGRNPFDRPLPNRRPAPLPWSPRI